MLYATPTGRLRVVRIVSLVFILALISVAAPGCSRSSKPPGVDSLQIEELKVGEGDPVEVGDKASIHYTGWVYDPTGEQNRGTYFDGSLQRGVPFHMRPDPGSGGVIEGWHQGVLGMRLGGVRQIIIPPDMAYGDQSAAGGVIIPHSTLVFELELVRLEKAKD